MTLHDRIRQQLTGAKAIGMFDMLEDGEPVDMDTLFDALNSTPGIFEPRAKLMRLRTYMSELNYVLGAYGLCVHYGDPPGFFRLREAPPCS